MTHLQPIAGIVALAVCAFALVNPAAPQSSKKTLYQKSFGSWNVECQQDAVYDHRGCGVSTQTATQNAARGQAVMSLQIFTFNLSQPPQLQMRVSSAFTQTFTAGLTMRVDEVPPVEVRCGSSRNDTCTIDGPGATELINAWRGGKWLIIRAYDFNRQNAFDYVYDLRDFTKAVADFDAVRGRYLTGR